MQTEIQFNEICQVKSCQEYAGEDQTICNGHLQYAHDQANDNYYENEDTIASPNF